jgi:hypothetical protein
LNKNFCQILLCTLTDAEKTELVKQLQQQGQNAQDQITQKLGYRAE